MSDKPPKLLPRCQYEIRKKHVILVKRGVFDVPSFTRWGLSDHPPMPRIVFKPMRGKRLSGIDDYLKAGCDPREWWPALEQGLIWTHLPSKLDRVCRADVHAIIRSDPPIGSECEIHRIPFLAWLEGIISKDVAYDWGTKMLHQLPGYLFFENEVRAMDARGETTAEKVHHVAQQALLYPRPYAVAWNHGWYFVD